MQISPVMSTDFEGAAQVIGSSLECENASLQIEEL